MHTMLMLLAVVLGAVVQHAPPPPPESAPGTPSGTIAPALPVPAAPVPAAPVAPGPIPAPTPAPVPQATGTGQTVAIVPFDATLPRYIFGVQSDDGECGSVERNGADLARRATIELLEAVVATQRFTVLDRDMVDRVLKEQNFLRTQGVESSELARLGRLLGADRIIVSSLELAGTSCRRIEVRASGYLAFEFNGGIEIAYRVLNVATGEIEAMGRLTRTWDSKQTPELRPVLASPDGAATFFIRQAVMEQTRAVLDAIDPIKVAAVQDGMIILNQGRGRPMMPGATLRVMIKGTPIRDPNTGRVLTDEAGEAAIIQVVAVEEKISRARVLAGDATKIAIGASCRTLDVPAPN